MTLLLLTATIRASTLCLTARSSTAHPGPAQPVRRAQEQTTGEREQVAVELAA